jgi:integrase
MQAERNRPSKRKPQVGINERHSRTCRSANGGTCNCQPSYRAWVYDRRSGEKIRQTFAGKGALAAAKRWRADALSMQNRGQLQRETRETVREVGDEWLEKAKRGLVSRRTKVKFKPSTLRDYESALEQYIYPDLGAVRLSDLRRGDVQALVDRLGEAGLAGSTVRNAIMPLRVIAGYAITRKGLVTNPTTDLELPAPGEHRDRAATITEARVLLDALPDDVQAVYATAFYAGLRRGELRGLRVTDLHGLDGDGGAWIQVERGWDDVDGEIAPKTRAGKRRVPVCETLRAILAAHIEQNGRKGAQLVFGPDGTTPFLPNTIRRHAHRAWAAVAVGAFLRGELPDGVEVDPIGLHEARHTFASWLSAAGFPKERRQWWLGHADEDVTDEYTHELDGQLAADASRLEAYAGTSEATVIPIRAASGGSRS